MRFLRQQAVGADRQPDSFRTPVQNHPRKVRRGRLSFNSYEFLLAFFPILLIGYYLLGRAKQQLLCNIWLLIGSVVFYLWFSVPMSLVLLLSMLVNYLLYRGILKQREANRRAAKGLCTLGVILNVLLLFVFKYAVTCALWFSALTHTAPVIQSIVVPVGISFFTFSQISLLVDTYRGEFGKCSALDYALYVLLFIKILSGPIVSAGALIPQFHDESRKKPDYARFSRGVYAFSIGLAKKVLLADFLDIITSACFGNVAACTGFEAAAAILAYSLQIYFDFSGYCDMAFGIGLMLNLDIPQNFNSPYQSTDIIDFWKRWHMTLTAFLTKYVYYPLGGNRKGKARQYLNILIVFLISGIWHGAGLTFIVWGLLHGVLNILTRVCKSFWEKAPRLLRVPVTFLSVTVGWVFFRAATLADAVRMLAKPFTAAFGSINADLVEAMRQPTLFSIACRVLPFKGAMALLFGVCLFIVFFAKNTHEQTKAFRPTLVRAIISAALIAVSTLSLTNFASFIYGGF